MQFTKTDDNDNPLSCVGFTLYDASKRTISTKTTDRSGIVTFSDLDLGNYYYAETSALPGYVLDSTQYPVSISSNGQVVKKTMTNTPEKGGLQITKTDDSGNPLTGVGFTLYDSSKRTISTKTTDSSGIVSFSDLAPAITTTPKQAPCPVMSRTPHSMQSPSRQASSLLVKKTVTNERIPSKGSLKLVKTDENGTPIASTGFQLLDSDGNRIASGGTDSSGVLVFSDLPLGNYFYQETFAVPGYALDDIGRSFMAEGDAAIVAVAQTQIGNEGGLKYCEWYGYSYRVEWCAIFVSWCADQCGYLDAGILPKELNVIPYAEWFRERDQWQYRDYETSPGDLIFYDWESDGLADHVGIVERVEDGVIYSIEGNAGDACIENSHYLATAPIYGYGTPLY